MNETYVTLRGWLGADVRHRLAGDTPVAEFRLGVTPRWFDSKRSEWVDAPTQWYTVKAWRHLEPSPSDSRYTSESGSHRGLPGSFPSGP